MPTLDLDEQLAVLDWRLKLLLGMGLSETDATRLAVSEADVHQVEQLLSEGCPPHLLVPILV